MYLSLRDRPAAAASDGRRDATAAPQTTLAEPTPQGRRVARVVLTLGMVSLLTDVSSESVNAVLPLYLTTGLGLSPMAFGFVDGLYQGVSVLVRVVAGWAADRSGRPQPVALAGYVLSLVARVLMLGASGVGSIAAVVSVDRIGKGVRTAPRDAMIAASAPPARLGLAFGVHRALDTVGATIGPLMAFVILWQIPGGFRTILVLSLGFALLGVTVLALFVPLGTGAVQRGARAHRPASAGRRWREVATPGLVRTLCAAGALALLTVGDGFVYLALLADGGFSARWFPVLYVGTSLAYLALAVPLGRLADRVGRIRVLVLGHLPLAAAYLCAASGSGALAPTVAVLLLLGTFYAATDGVLAAVAGRLVPAPVRTTGIASAQTTVALARLLAGSGFGLLWAGFGPRPAMAAVAVALLLVVPVALAVLRHTEPAA